jgi:hypothetical protein
MTIITFDEVEHGSINDAHRMEHAPAFRTDTRANGGSNMRPSVTYRALRRNANKSASVLWTPNTYSKGTVLMKVEHLPVRPNARIRPLRGAMA